MRRGAAMKPLPLAVGDEVTYSKTVGESDIMLFASITGDYAPNHVDEAYMAGTAYGRRIAHGALLVGLMSTASTLIIDQAGGPQANPDETPVSLGYDRIRFLAPVYIGDVVRVQYQITEADPEARRTRSEIRVTNQLGIQVAVAQHILKWVQV